MTPLALLTLAPRRALAAADSAMATTVQRLSTGLRVNSARDDAAGLAIAERLTARLRGTQQGERNANDAISMLRTADGTLQALGDLLQRMRELLLQARNASNGSDERTALDNEMNQARDELTRIAQAARFNGIPLLAGADAAREHLFQIGAGRDDTLSLAVGAPMTAGDIGAVAIARSVDLRTLNGAGGFAFAGTYTTVAVTQLDFSKPQLAFRGGSARTAGAVATDYGGNAAQFQVDGQTVTLNANYGSASGVAAAVQGQLSGYTVQADGGALVITKSSAVPSPTAAPAIANGTGALSAPFTGASGSAGQAAQSTTNAGFTVDGRRVSITQDHSSGAESLIADIQAQLDASAGSGHYRVGGGSTGISITRVGAIDPPRVSGFTGIGASVFGAAPRTGFELKAGELTVKVGDGPAQSVVGTFDSPQALAAVVAQQVHGATAAVNKGTGRLEILAAKKLTLGGSAAQSSGALAFESLEVEPTGSLLDADALDDHESWRSIVRVDAALDAVTLQRATLGASESRFDAVVSQLQVEAGLVAASRGRIVDADIAQETSALSRQRILQQAATAVVAQANARAGDVLALLVR